MFRLVYDSETGQAVQIADTPSDLRDFLARGYRMTPLAAPTLASAETPEPVKVEPQEAPPAGETQEVVASETKQPPAPVDPSKVYVNTATLPTLAAQLNISTTALRVLKNNRPFENFDQLNELVKLEGLDWTAFMDRLSFEK